MDDPDPPQRPLAHLVQVQPCPHCGPGRVGQNVRRSGKPCGNESLHDFNEHAYTQAEKSCVEKASTRIPEPRKESGKAESKREEPEEIDGQVDDIGPASE